MNYQLMKILLLFVLGVTILHASAQEDRLGLTQDEFEDVFVSSTEYSKLMERLSDLETNEDSLTQNINSLENEIDSLKTSLISYNENQSTLLYATVALVSATIVSIFLSLRYTSKTLQVTNQQLKASERDIYLKDKEQTLKYKADLRIKLVQTNFRKRTIEEKEEVKFIVRYNVHNHGTVGADFIKIYYKIYEQEPATLKQIISDEKEIKKTSMPISGNLLPDAGKDLGFNVIVDEVKPKHVIFWVEYGYEDMEDEIIYQFFIRGGENENQLIHTYTHDLIIFEMENKTI